MSEFTPCKLWQRADRKWKHGDWFIDDFDVDAWAYCEDGRWYGEIRAPYWWAIEDGFDTRLAAQQAVEQELVKHYMERLAKLGVKP